jgi:Cu(I)/Ag(I) efflux system membrane fusion protein
MSLDSVHPRRRFLSGLAATMVLAGCGKAVVPAADPKVAYYTCTMHPEVRSQDSHGTCPICGMNLVPVTQETAAPASAVAAGPGVIDLPPERLQAVGARIGTVSRRLLSRPLSAPGSVVIDEAGLRDVNVKSPGYIVKLAANYVGKPVAQGEPLMTVLCEGWIDAQLDYLRAYRSYARTSGGAMNRNSLLAFDSIDRLRKRLRVWDLSEGQIADLEKFALTMSESDLRTGKGLKGTFDLLSPVTGHVHMKNAVEGMRFEAGQSLLQLIDLSTVWVEADFPEDQARFVAPGTVFAIRFPARPEAVLRAPVAFVNPHLDGATRRQTVRFVLPNPGHALDPGMYAEVSGEAAAGERLAVPADAVVPTGRRYAVFVDRGGGKIEPRFVRLGERFGDDYEVLGGLADGDRVVVGAAFLVDAESRVRGALKGWGEDDEAPAATGPAPDPMPGIDHGAVK